MSNLNYGSNRSPSLKRGTRVICNLYKMMPERISKRTGLLKPAEMRTTVLAGKVLADHGRSIYVEVKYPSGYTRDMSFFPHEVTVEADFDKGLTTE